MRAPWWSSALAALGVLLAGCASQAEQAATRLPFHVAVLPVAVTEASFAPQLEGSETEVFLALDDDTLSEALVDALRGSFSKATLLSGAGDGETADQRLAAARSAAAEQGADLLLDMTVRFHPAIHTELNDRFWLNLPLFALGGPATWFVNDRSYHFYVEWEVELFDVAAGAIPVVALNRPIQEASLNFLDRAGGAGAWGLSLIAPSGLVAPESDEVPGELQAAIAEELCQALTGELHKRTLEVTRGEGLEVDFYPQDVRLARDGHGRCLAGEIVLEFGGATDLRPLGYRLGDGPFVPVTWSAVEEPTSGRVDRRRYRFHIPLPDTEAATIQLEVEQDDRFSTRRTFTYPIAPPEES